MFYRTAIDFFTEIPDCSVILLNACYFNGSWSEKFDKSLTKKHIFINENGMPSSVLMMSGINAKGYSSKEMDVVQLPYGNGKFIMTAMLPKTSKDLDKCSMKFLTADLSKFENMIYQLSFPKFEISSKYSLLEILEMSGINFKEHELSNLIENSPSVGIDKIIQKTFLKTDEEGSEGGAVTGALIAGGAVEPTPLIFNRPFYFTITEKTSGAIIFIGKVAQL